MNSTIDMQTIRQLSVAERLQVIEDIWDTIATDPDSLPMPESHKVELDRRLAVHESDPQGRPWRDFVSRLANSE